MDLDFLEAPITMSSLDAVTYNYFEEMIHNRTVIINGEIGDDFVNSVYIPLRRFENDDSNEPVSLILNSVGGSVYDALFLCNVIDNYKKPLNVTIAGYAMSMGAIIACAGKNNPNVKKFCHQFSIALIHAGEIGVQGEQGSVKDIMEFNEKLNTMVKNYIIKSTNITEEEYDKHERKQWYMTSDDMLKYGLVDSIIGCDC